MSLSWYSHLYIKGLVSMNNDMFICGIEDNKIECPFNTRAVYPGITIPYHNVSWQSCLYNGDSSTGKTVFQLHWDNRRCVLVSYER